MEMNVNDEQRIVEVWLSRAERNDAALAQRLRSQCKPYAEKGYFVVYFQSGDGNLYENTLDLLRYNRKRSARQAVAKEKSQVS